MFRVSLLSICLCPFFGLLGDSLKPQECQDVTAIEGLPSSLVNQTVCAISGAYTDAVIDLILPGPESLVIQRSYSSNGGINLGHSWSLNHRTRLLFSSV